MIRSSRIGSRSRFLGLSRNLRRTAISTSPDCALACGFGFRGFEQAKRVAAPDLGEVLFGISRGEKSLRDLAHARHVLHARHAAAAIPVETDADVIGTD